MSQKKVSTTKSLTGKSHTRAVAGNGHEGRRLWTVELSLGGLNSSVLDLGAVDGGAVAVWVVNVDLYRGSLGAGRGEVPLVCSSPLVVLGVEGAGVRVAHW